MEGRVAFRVELGGGHMEDNIQRLTLCMVGADRGGAPSTFLGSRASVSLSLCLFQLSNLLIEEYTIIRVRSMYLVIYIF